MGTRFALGKVLAPRLKILAVQVWKRGAHCFDSLRSVGRTGVENQTPLEHRETSDPVVDHSEVRDATLRPILSGTITIRQAICAKILGNKESETPSL